MSREQQLLLLHINKRVITMKKGVKVEDSKGEEQTDEY